MRFIVLVAILGLSSCYQPSYTNGGLQCGPAGDCPRGFTCVQNRCYREGEGLDLSSVVSSDMSVSDLSVGPDMMSTLPICVFGTNKYGDACRFGP